MEVVQEELTEMQDFINELAGEPLDGEPWNAGTILIDVSKSNPFELLDNYPHSHEFYNFIKEVDKWMKDARDSFKIELYKMTSKLVFRLHETLQELDE